MREFRFTVTKEDEGLGVKKLIRRHFDFSSRLFAKLKAQERITLNGEVLRGWMVPKEGDVVIARLPDEKSGFEPEDIPVIPVYEDQDILVIDKPPGYTVHPTKGHPCHTMANGIMKYMLETGQDFKIRFANRLDMDTSGLLVIAKNSHAQDEIIRQMDAGSFVKKYKALVFGELIEDDFVIDKPIGQSDPTKVGREVMTDGTGKDSVTVVHVAERFRGYTLVELELKTGRTHQIRVHLSHIGHPIVGDPLYGGESPLLPRQALHAYYLNFSHPAEDRELELTSEIPEDIQNAIAAIKEE
ncbi:MAG: RluA family pseudouridine synthase [Eubacterium sp.]|nr:RluA family pseudouridine synthase [Eubacterium sp.]